MTDVMELFTVQCETCAARLKVRDAAAIGDILECPKCGSFVQVVAPQGWQPPAAKAPQDVDPSETKRPAPPPLPVKQVEDLGAKTTTRDKDALPTSSHDFGSLADVGLDLTDDRQLSAKARQASSATSKRRPPPLPNVKSAAADDGAPTNAATEGTFAPDVSTAQDWAVSPVESAARKWLMFCVGAAAALLVVFALWNTLGNEDESIAAGNSDHEGNSVDGKSVDDDGGPTAASPHPPISAADNVDTPANAAAVAKIEPRVPATAIAAIRLAGNDEREWNWTFALPLFGGPARDALAALRRDFNLPPDAVQAFSCALAALDAQSHDLLVLVELNQPLTTAAMFDDGAQELPDTIEGRRIFQRPQGEWIAPYVQLDDHTLLTGPIALLRAALIQGSADAPTFRDLSPSLPLRSGGSIGAQWNAEYLREVGSQLDWQPPTWLKSPSALEIREHLLRGASSARWRVHLHVSTAAASDDTLLNPDADIELGLVLTFADRESARSADAWLSAQIADLREQLRSWRQLLEATRQDERRESGQMLELESVLATADLCLTGLTHGYDGQNRLNIRWFGWNDSVIELAAGLESPGTADQFAALSTDPPPDPDPHVPVEPTLPPRVELSPATMVDVAARLADKLPAIDLPPLPLDEFAEFITRLSTIPITFDLEAMSRIGVTPSVQVSVKRMDTTVGAVLTAVLGERGLKYEIVPGGLVISAASHEGAFGAVRYDVHDLAGMTDDAMSDFAKLTRRLVAPRSWSDGPGAEGGMPGTLAIEGRVFVVVQSSAVHHELRRFFDRLRVARGLVPRELPPDVARLETPLASAGETLRKPVTANFRQPTPLARIVEYLGQQSDTNLFIDGLALRNIGLSADAKVEFVAADTPLGDALEQLCRPLDLAFRLIDGDTVQITSRAAAAAMLELEFYPLADLIAQGEGISPLLERLQRSSPDAWKQDSVGAHHFDAVSKTLIVAQPQEVQMRLEHSLAALRAERMAGQESSPP